MKRIALTTLATVLGALLLAGSPAEAGKGGGAAAALTPHDPVVFVHGYMGWGGNWNSFINWFKADGWTAGELFTFSYNSTGDSNVKSAQSLATFVNNVLSQTGASQVDIVAHSNGGLVARYYMLKNGGAAKVDQLVAIGTPHKGTTTAYACLSPACFEMRAGSSFLSTLGTKECDASYWSPCDEIIIPNSSAQCGRNAQTACLGHVALLGSSSVYAGVRNYITP